jgi:molecular chaperone DnaJ
MSAAADFYATLGVSPEASDDEIKKAYRQLVMRYHPDRNPGDAVAETRIREINAAYEVLGDPEARRSYERLRFGPERRWEEERADPDAILREMEAKLADEGRKDLFALLMKQVARIKEELAILRERTVARHGYDAFKEGLAADRAREVLDELRPEEMRLRHRRLVDVALQMMITQKVVGPNDEAGRRSLRAELEEEHRKGMIGGYMSALELFYTRK